MSKQRLLPDAILATDAPERQDQDHIRQHEQRKQPGLEDHVSQMQSELEIMRKAVNHQQLTEQTISCQPTDRTLASNRLLKQDPSMPTGSPLYSPIGRTGSAKPSDVEHRDTIHKEYSARTVDQPRDTVVNDSVNQSAYSTKYE